MRNRTAGPAFIVLGVVFMAIGLTQGQNAYLSVGVVFLAIGIGVTAKGRKKQG